MKSVSEIAADARRAALKLANVPAERKNAALEILARRLAEGAGAIIAENSSDLAAAEKSGLSGPMLERLSLDAERIARMAEGVRQVASLPDPVGEIVETSVRPNGLKIVKVRVPIGVIGVIYESRPNVTIDCAALCIKSGNAAILRGGSEAFKTNMALAKIIGESLSEAGLDPNCVQLIPTCERSALGELLKLDRYVDCIIPRGGEGLIRFVVENSSVPVIKHYKGVCTVYLDKSADERLSKILTIDAKCQRPSVCNAAENLIVHSGAAEKLLPPVARELAARGVQLRASARAKAVLQKHGIACVDASPEDFKTEYVDLIISVDLVDSAEDAVDFINANGSGHSDLIVAQDARAAEIFQNGVDGATVYWNASTRFTDGFEFGLGAEIGISTDKLHARGPMGLREMCSYKYKIFGDGQTRGAPADV
ncbi:MAG: glutamate-5-semialdehyde dehydrogenase [Verrucomicrobia bacterium]|nr:MAG: glutamate-5-semialdehyde dehydrogenase [Verrucomicrobiota bacterium]